MDNFTYNYVGLDGNPNASSTSRSNRLNYVSDSGANDGVADDITNTQTTNNYLYDAIGQLLSDVDEGIDTMYWRYGDKKLRKIIRNDQNSAQLEFYYNPLGQRIIKLEKPRSSGVVLDTAEWVYTYYTYDANGQVMGVYQAQIENGPANDQAILEELNIYGSSRIGQIKPERTVWYNGEVYNGAPQVWQNILGERSYEMTNHLGNVLAVVNDRKLWNATDTLYEAVLLMSSDYYPYGMTMPGRNYNNSEYRYGMSAKEKDDEIMGIGNSYDFGARMLNPRLGRWLSKDPHSGSYPSTTPYSAMDNNPILLIDPDGRDIIDFMKVIQEAYKVQGKVLQSSVVYMTWLSSFADIHSGDDSDGLGITSSGIRSDINLRFQSIACSGWGSTEILYNGVDLRALRDSDIQNASINDFEILISLTNRPDFNSSQVDAGEKLLTVIHESALHAETFAKLLESFKSGNLTASELISKYEEATDGDGELNHLEITSGSNVTYESMISDASKVLRNVNTRTNQSFIAKELDDNSRSPYAKSRYEKMAEKYGKYRNKPEPRDWYGGNVTLLDVFNYSYDMDKGFVYNPEHRGKKGNHLKKTSTPKIN